MGSPPASQWPPSTPALVGILAEVPSSHLPASGCSSFLERFVVPIEIAEGLSHCKPGRPDLRHRVQRAEHLLSTCCVPGVALGYLPVT